MLNDRTARGDTLRCSGDSGSALMLMPAAVMITLLLGALAVDLSHQHLTERQLRGIAASAANNAVAAGIDLDTLHRDGRIVIDRTHAVAAAHRTVASHAPGGLQPAVVAVDIDTTATVTVTLRTVVHPTFARVLPANRPRELVVRASAQPALR